MIKRLFHYIGPGTLVTAAFIGPGTVFVCTVAGYQFGYELLWALGLSIVITVLLQEVSGRIGLITGKDLGELIREEKNSIILKITQLTLVLIAIVLGNIAYESGNITGATLGLDVFVKLPTTEFLGISIQSGNFLIGSAAFLFLWFAKHQWVERVLLFLVLAMSLSFVVTAIQLNPIWPEVFRGFVPSIRADTLPSMMALLGTTVVPYNLFLYASLSKKKWKDPKSLPWMRWDIGISVLLGGGISMAILIVGSFNQSGSLESALDVAYGLEQVFGVFGTYMMAFGLLAAGLTSSITAPLAGALVICGLFGLEQSTRSLSMRVSMLVILGFGLVFASLGIRPVELIKIAQVANGLLLPFISSWLIWLASKKAILGAHRNPTWLTAIMVVIALVTLILGIRSISGVFNVSFV